MQELSTKVERLQQESGGLSKPRGQEVSEDPEIFDSLLSVV